MGRETTNNDGVLLGCVCAHDSGEFIKASPLIMQSTNVISEDAWLCFSACRCRLVCFSYGSVRRCAVFVPVPVCTGGPTLQHRLAAECSTFSVFARKQIKRPFLFVAAPIQRGSQEFKMLYEMEFINHLRMQQ